jgi:hypothetical protein
MKLGWRICASLVLQLTLKNTINKENSFLILPNLLPQISFFRHHHVPIFIGGDQDKTYFSDLYNNLIINSKRQNVKHYPD